ncbi:MAG: FtsX-like permease family protein [Abditibacteriales bacterium]|nr:FtsX-like permease family protein [Abditibacteriales bacterium]MDW8368061.1 FtsX-like permease family protein [Abditibacteriales bacterium]
MLALAAKNLWSHKSRTLWCVLGVAVTGGLLFDMSLLANGLQASILSILNEMGYDIRLAPKGTLPFETEATIPNAHRIMEEIARHPKVKFTAALFGATFYLQKHPSAQPLAVYALAMDKGAEREFRRIAGQGLSAGDPHYANGRFDGPWTGELIINRRLAEKEKLRVGDRVLLAPFYNAPLRAMQNPRPFTVRGIADFRFDLRQQYTVALHVSEAQDMKGKAREDRVSLILVELKSPGDIPVMLRWLRRRFPLVEVFSIEEFIRRLSASLFYFRQFSLILSSVSLAVAFLLVLSIVTVSFNERVGEIAVLRAIGFRARRVAMMVLWEGCLLTLLSAPFALLIGWLAAIPLDNILRRAPSLPQELHFFVLTPEAVVRTLILLIVTGGVAAAYPAFLAARLPIASTMRREIV